MKKFYFAFVAIACTMLACVSTYKRVIPQDNNTAPESKDTMPAESTLFFTKYFKMVTGQGYTRNIERNYYGKQDHMLEEMMKYDVRKGINIENYNKYSKASFFPVDDYKIPDAMKSLAVDMFKPLIDTVISMAQKQSFLRAEIVVLGYADESEIPVNSAMYGELLKMSRKKAFYNNDYYNTLSYYRAKEVGDILSALLSNQKNRFKLFDKVIFDILVEGRGIEYPDSKREYELVDEKRRITKIYWKTYP